LGVIVKLIQIDNFSEKGLARPTDQKVEGVKKSPAISGA